MHTQTGELDMLGVDILLQTMTGGADMAGSRRKLPDLLYSYNGLYSKYCFRDPSYSNCCGGTFGMARIVALNLYFRAIFPI